MSKKEIPFKKLKSIIEKSGLFDKIYYLRTYPDARRANDTPLDHFIKVGLKEDRKPNEHFDPTWYREYYEDVREDGAYPFIHYILFGEKENRMQNGNINNIKDDNIRINNLKTYLSKKLTHKNYSMINIDEFDAQFYLFTNLDVKAAGIDSLTHYMQNGWLEGRKPNVWFDTQYYLENNPDVKESNIEPFQHYQLFGQNEFREINPFISIEQLNKIITNGYFDKEYYLNQYEDVKNSAIDPLYHYITSGYKEHRNPSVAFDSFYYMQKYHVDFCPLLHYIENENNSTLPNNAVILEGEKDYTTNKKIAIQVHMFYTDLVPQVKKYLNNIPFKFDLLISVMTEADKIYIQNSFEDIDTLNNIFVEVVENIGRDISPLLITFKDAWYNYDYLCHIHTKRSLHTDWGDMWRTYLFDKLFGNSSIVKQIIKFFDENSSAVILYPENFNKIKKYTLMDGNVDDINQILDRLQLAVENSYTHYQFAAGSMQWFRTKSFRELIALDFKYEDFKNTNTLVDGTLAHAMERFFSIYAQKKGKDIVPYYSMSNSMNLESESRQYSLDQNLGDKWMRDDPKITLNANHPISPMHKYYNKSSLNIHWVIPDFGIGAGGHMTIFRMVYFLEQLGHRQTIWIQNARNYKTPTLAKETIATHYQPIGNQVDVHFLPDDTEWISGDVVFATDCWTAYPVYSMSKFKKRCYFIQDYEPMFHPMGENYLIAEQTYSFGFTAITAGKWLKKKAEDHGMIAYDFPLCADEEVYNVNNTNKYRIEDKINIAFYSRSYTPRRAVKLGFTGLSELAKMYQNIHVHCFGQDDLPVVPDFEYTNHGIMSLQQLAELYNSCDVGIVFSATNYSLIPLEMMACGLPIVEMDVESTRYVFDESIVTFAKPNAVSIAQSVKAIIENESKRENQIAAGLEFLKEISWKKAADNINKAIYIELEKENYTGLDIDSITNSGFSSKTHATVVIPTLNAEPEIEHLLKTILSQKTIFTFDILVIDSASDDQTPKILNEYADQYENISYISIERKYFQHGRTRDMGIEKAKGDYVAFLTQDALPHDDNWLEQLIKGFSVDKKIVGIFGKHVAYDEHSPFVKRDISNHFKNFDTLPKIYSWYDEMPSHITHGSLEWQMKMMFYSDNNSAISKKAWKSIPYPHISWGEDQVWAWTVVQLGLKKYYAQDAIVYHSHDDSYDTRLKVSRIEKSFFYDNFGIHLFQSPEHAKATKGSLDNQDKEFCKQNGIDEEELTNQILLNEATIIGRSGYSIKNTEGK